MVFFLRVGTSIANVMKWQCLQHAPFEGPGHLVPWAESRGHTFRRTEVWTGVGFPAPNEFDGLFVLGGPMNVYEEDRYGWLAREKAFLREAIWSGKPVVGICLGAQLLSVVLGGVVTRNRCKEIGWFPVNLTREGRQAALFEKFPNRCLAFHWHGDRFSIPPGALHVASTEACAEQAFVYGDRVIGLQFHLEATKEGIAALLHHCGEEIAGPRDVPPPSRPHEPYVQDRTTIEASAGHLSELHRLLDVLLDRLVEL